MSSSNTKRSIFSNLAVASLFLLFSSVGWTALTLYSTTTSFQNSTTSIETWTNFSYFVASLFFTVGSLMFFFASTPSSIEALYNKLQNQNIESMSFADKYFYGNDLVIASWLFFFGISCFYFYPIYAYSKGQLSLDIFIAFIVLLTILDAFAFLWVISTFSSSMIMNHGMGSAYFFEFFCFLDCCCDQRTCTDKAFGTDFKVGAFAIMIVSICLLVLNIFEIVIDFQSTYLWLQLVIIIFFNVGAIVMYYATYDYVSSSIWDVFIDGASITELFSHDNQEGMLYSDPIVCLSSKSRDDDMKIERKNWTVI